MSSRLRTIFMGTPDFAVHSLRALAACPDVNLLAVFSQPDRPAGRGQRLTPPPVADAARTLGLPLLQPPTLRDPAVVARLRDAAPDLVVVAAYGQILRQDVLDLPRFGCLNVHASLLPRWRGAAPIHRAVAANDAVTGVSIMRMERGLDTGPVWAMDATMIGATETSGELHDRLAALGADLLVRTLPRVVAGHERPTPQADPRATHAPKLGRADRDIDFHRPAPLVAAHINGMSPSPGAAITIDGEAVTLVRARPVASPPPHAEPGTIVAASPADGLRITTADGGAVDILEAKRPGRRALPANELLRGWSLAVGTRVAPLPGT